GLRPDLTRGCAYLLRQSTAATSQNRLRTGTSRVRGTRHQRRQIGETCHLVVTSVEPGQDVAGTGTPDSTRDRLAQRIELSAPFKRAQKMGQGLAAEPVRAPFIAQHVPPATGATLATVRCPGKG